MTLDEHVEYLKNYINQFKNITEVELIRIVYIYLGKIFKFDARYGFGNRKAKEKMYDSTILKKTYYDYDTFNNKVIKDIVIDENKINKCIKDGYAICTIISGALKYILNKLKEELQEKFKLEFDIEVKPELPKYGIKQVNQHVYNIVTFRNGKKAILDLEQDLEAIQSLRKTNNFLKDIETGSKLQSDEEIREIDVNKANYIPEGFYFEDMIGHLKKAISNKELPLEDKVKMIIDNIGVYTRTYKEMGYVQRRNYHHMFFKEALDSEELLEKIEFRDCFYEGEDKNKSYRTCIFIELPQNKHKIYMFSLEKYKYEEIAQKQLADMMNGGLQIYDNGKVPIPRFNKLIMLRKTVDK